MDAKKSILTPIGPLHSTVGGRVLYREKTWWQWTRAKRNPCRKIRRTRRPTVVPIRPPPTATKRPIRRYELDAFYIAVFPAMEGPWLITVVSSAGRLREDTRQLRRMEEMGWLIVREPRLLGAPLVVKGAKNSRELEAIARARALCMAQNYRMLRDTVRRGLVGMIPTECPLPPPHEAAY